MKSASDRLVRELRVGGAVMMGLGSIIGTGVFVSIGIATGIAGPAVILAIILATVVASCNGLSSAQLAANHPVSGGTYEYGYRYLGPSLGFTAGWMFLFAKSASAATAALGFSGYLIQITGINRGLLIPIAFAAAAVLTLIVLSGMRRSNWTNIAIVSVTLASLAYFVFGGIASLGASPDATLVNLQPFFLSPDHPDQQPTFSILHATALMFVAFTGYGRIATLGEEVRAPRTTIPRAIIITLVVVGLLYISVSIVAVGAIGADALNEATRTGAAPLEIAARAIALPGLAELVAIGAMTAMLGVLLNLILGLSRVMLAMGRRGDMPAATGRLNTSRTTPIVATVAVGAIVALLTLSGDVRTTWSFSAFTVLIYYAITNAAALKLAPSERLFHPAISWGGLASCLFLAFWVDVWIWLLGVGVIAAGFVWFAIAQRSR